jgi:hypothetical protein
MHAMFHLSILAFRVFTDAEARVLSVAGFQCIMPAWHPIPLLSQLDLVRSTGM